MGYTLQSSDPFVLLVFVYRSVLLYVLHTPVAHQFLIQQLLATPLLRHISSQANMFTSILALLDPLEGLLILSTVLESLSLATMLDCLESGGHD